MLNLRLSAAVSRLCSIKNGRLCSSDNSNENLKTPTADDKDEKNNRRTKVRRFPGDSGRTYLLSGKRLPKSHFIFDALGHTEELNDFVGVSRHLASRNKHPYEEHLKRIQTVLIDIQILISKNSRKASPDLVEHRKELEEWLDIFGKELEQNEKYIVPGGSSTTAFLQVTRSVCKRAERAAIAVARENLVTKDVPIYLNRLAKFMFVISRVSCKLDDRTELVYIPKRTKTPE